ncbi:MAG: DNA-3-methyladenine glycosylase 2 family protein [Dehalococcoidia bacterium]|nr:DNA-3-methyladenine glycosylase 2 family protein [Dehalococcoidia bacterium]
MDAATLEVLLATQPDAPRRGFNAVRTTGIYCRDGCAGRPRAHNVTRFATTVAAEAAGYRPCLLCRPDRLPASASSPHEVVERALILISAGALDEETEEGLASRVGVTARHLRRLFQDHVGATPAFVARSRRAHFARRLLDETDLRMIDVAAASGFASVRQMNRVMRDVFRFTPAELRARRRQRDRLVADGGLRLRVPFDGALAFEELLAYLAPRAIPGVEVIADGAYRRTTSTHGEPGVIEVSRADDHHLLVVAHLPAWTTLIDDVGRVRRLFGLDAPTAEDTPLVDDALLGPLVARQPGLRAPGAWDQFETAVRVFLGQQVTVAGATTLAGRLVEALGRPVAGLEPLGLTHVFPAASDLAEASVERLRAIGMPEARARALREFARAYVDGRVRLDPATPLDEATQALEALPGVGPWTAQLIALRAMGLRDAFPAGDLGLRRNAARWVGEDAPLDGARLEAMAEAWRPHRALAALHLWFSGRVDAGG